MKKKIKTYEVGFNGIVVIGWDEEILKWIPFNSNDGKHFVVTQDKLKPTVKKVIYLFCQT